MSVRSVFNPNVATIDIDSDVQRAAELMRQEHVGDLVVTERDGKKARPVGVITDRDIVLEIVARGIAPSSIRAADLIRRDLLTLREDNGVSFALHAMRQAGVRRAPVVDGNGALVGVLSLDDVIDHLAAQLADLAAIIREQQLAEHRQTP